MPKIESIVRVEMDPYNPVPEICAVMLAVLPYNPGNEEAILKGVQDVIQARLKRLEQMKGGTEHAEPLRESNREREDQG